MKTKLIECNNSRKPQSTTKSNKSRILKKVAIIMRKLKNKKRKAGGEGDTVRTDVG